MPPLLVDLSAAPEEACNDCLGELFAKAAEAPAGADIWDHHPNPYLTDHVEAVTLRLQAIISAIQDAFSRLMFGTPAADLLKAEVPWLRWDAAGLEEARIRLTSKPPHDYTLDDWMLMVDFIIQRYLPEGTIRTEAEYLAVRAAFAGKIQNRMAADRPEPDTIRQVMELAPAAFGLIQPRILTPSERAAMDMAYQRGCMAISDLTESTRRKMKGVVLEYVTAMVWGARQGSTQHLQTRLFEEFAVLNRDLRRIAVTETGEACSAGIVAATAPGGRLRRIEAYKGACAFCRSINGKIVTVVSPAEPKKDGEREVWVGKTNIGRSASPRKRQGSLLVEREPQEKWWIAAGVQHPHCRGTWTPVSEKPPEVSQSFEDWLQEQLRAASPRARANAPYPADAPPAVS